MTHPPIQPPIGQRRLAALLASVSLCLAAGAHAQQQPPYHPCGQLKNSFGPLDYRTASQADKSLVEDFHFTPEVETLQKGATGSLAADIGYTLRAFPNHSRALMSMVKLGEKFGERPQDSIYTVECWIDRGLRFAPNDGRVHLVYGIYLMKKGDKKGAASVLETSRDLIKDDPNVHYNLGLVYFDLGRFEDSLKHAHLAYKGGFPLAGLKNKLMRANKWKEPGANL